MACGAARAFRDGVNGRGYSPGGMVIHMGGVDHALRGLDYANSGQV